MIYAAILIGLAVLGLVYFRFRKLRAVPAQPPVQAVDWQDLGEYSFRVYSSFYTWMGHPDLDSEDFHDAAYSIFHKKTGLDRAQYNQLFANAWTATVNDGRAPQFEDMAVAVSAFIVESYALLNPAIRHVEQKQHGTLSGFFAQVQSAASQRASESLKHVQPATTH